MSSVLNALLREIEDIRRALEQDEVVDAQALEDLSERVCSAAPALDLQDRRPLVEAWDVLVVAAAASRDRLGEELRRLGSGRRALKGYAHLRGHTRGQRLNKSV